MAVDIVDKLQFLARDVIYTSRAYAMMPVFICLSICLFGRIGKLTLSSSVMFVQWIPDIFACLDRWMSLLLTDIGSSDKMMP